MNQSAEIVQHLDNLFNIKELLHQCQKDNTNVSVYGKQDLQAVEHLVPEVCLIELEGDYENFKFNVFGNEKKWLAVSGDDLLKHTTLKKVVELYDDSGLGRLAKLNLCIAASSVEVERLFSAMKNVHTDKRQRLLPETLSKILRVKQNTDLKQKQVRQQLSSNACYQFFESKKRRGAHLL